MIREISVGVIGCGYWGPNLARNFDALASVRLDAVCDGRLERLAHMRKLFPEARGFQQLGDLLDHTTVDAVAVATSAPSHFEIARTCLLAGKHVCVEKPLAMAATECDELIRLAREKSLALMVGHTFLYSPALRKVRDLIASGEIGEVRHISTRRLNLGIVQKDINVVWDLAPHDLAIILALYGEMPHQINCQGSANLSPGIHDVANLWLTFPGRRSAAIQVSWLNPLKTREVSVVGTRKLIVYDDVSTHDKVRIFNSRVEAPRHYDSFSEFQYAYHYGDVFTPHVEGDEPLRVECQHFVDCIRDGTSPLTDGVRGRQVVSLIEAANRSLALHGAPVDMVDFS